MLSFLRKVFRLFKLQHNLSGMLFKYISALILNYQIHALPYSLTPTFKTK